MTTAELRTEREIARDCQRDNKKAAENNLEIIKYIAATLATIVITMVGFWLMIGKDYITRTEAREIAVKESVILATKLDIYIDEVKETKKVIEKNTEVLSSLKTELAVLSNALHELRMKGTLNGPTK